MDRRAIFHVHKNAVYRLEAEATSAAMTQPRQHCHESLILAIITGHIVAWDDEARRAPVLKTHAKNARDKWLSMIVKLMMMLMMMDITDDRVR